MEHNEFAEQIDSYLKNKLRGKRREDFEIHMLGCDECFKKLAVYEKVDLIFSEQNANAKLKKYGIDLGALLDKKIKTEGYSAEYKKILKKIKQSRNEKNNKKSILVLLDPLNSKKLSIMDKFYNKIQDRLGIHDLLCEQEAAILPKRNIYDFLFLHDLKKANQKTFIIGLMNVLNQQEKKIIKMSLFYDKKIGEIAKLLKQDPRAISRLKYQALNKIEKAIAMRFCKK